MRRTGIFWSITVLLLSSCNNIPDCDDSNTLEVVLQFRDSTNTAPELEIFDRIESLNQGFIFIEDSTLSMVTLEIDPTDTLTGYIFEGEGLTDTLILSYGQNQLLRSVQCGPQIIISGLTIQKQTFSDTLIVANDQLLKDEINIEIIR